MRQLVKSLLGEIEHQQKAETIVSRVNTGAIACAKTEGMWKGLRAHWHPPFLGTGLGQTENSQHARMKPTGQSAANRAFRSILPPIDRGV